MSSIERIEISGVRSFDPDPNKRQRIDFKKPLTVILGKNGAGKTTIIEALLNACTGGMPPGTAVEKSSFVYDPKAVGESSVKAQIRLLFTGKGGEAVQVIRSFQVTRARNKTTFATLDNIVAHRDEATGRIISRTYRAADVDNAVPSILEVSAAVLEHVIFCHQEDGNWPLAPSRVVKKIFDDIFAATRYVLALERLRENNKDLRSRQKEHEASLMTLSEHRDQARQLAQNIGSKEESVNRIKAEIDASAPELLKLQGVVSALNAVEQRVESLSREAAVIEGRIGEKRQSLSLLNVSLVGRSLEDLLRLKMSVEDKLKLLETSASGKKDLLERKVDELRHLEESVVGLRSSIEFRDGVARQYEKECDELKEIVSVLPIKFLENGDVNEQCLTAIMEYVNKELHQEEEKLSNELRSIDGKIRLVEERRSEGLRAMDTDGKEREMKEEQLGHLVKRHTEAKATLGSLGQYVTGAQVKLLQNTIGELEKRVEAEELLHKRDAKQKERQEILQSIEEQNKVIAEVRQELCKHRQRSSREAEMKLLRAQIADKEERISSKLQEELLMGLEDFGCSTDANQTLTAVTIQIEKLRSKAEDAVRSAEAQVSDVDRQLIALKQQRTLLEENVANEAIQLQRRRTHCLSKLGGNDVLCNFEATLRAARDAHHKLSGQLSESQALAACHNHLLQRARDEMKCPLCGRGFNEGDGVEGFLAAVKAKQQASTESGVTEDDVQRALQYVQALEQLEPDVSEVRRLTANAPQLEEALKAMNATIREKELFLEGLHDKREQVEDKLRRVQGLAHVAMEVNAMTLEKQALLQQLSRREATSAEECAQLHGDAASVGEFSHLSYEELSDISEAANTELHRLNVLLSEMQKCEEGGYDQPLVQQLTMKRSELCELKMRLTRQTELEATISQYKEQEESYIGRIAAIDDQRGKLMVELESCDADLKALREKKRSVEAASLQGQIGQLRRMLGLLSSLVPRLRNYIASRTGEQLREDREKFRVSEQRRAALAEEVAELRSSIEGVLRAIGEEQGVSVKVQKDIEYLEKKKSIEEDEVRLREVRGALAELKFKDVPGAEAVLGRDVVERESISGIRELLRSKISALECFRAKQEGVIKATQQEIKVLRDQLASEKYVDIEKRYRKAFLVVQTTEMAVADVDKYYRALGRAVQDYHQEKIAEVNEILADLWRRTYKGSDIDTIGLRSEDDEASTAARRSYTYRVVMKRGNVEMDMRGRCSAGQKVLASVLIRLALSEAFCCSCGILALDEPTTNLDEDNARSLAESLRALIEDRRSVKHFQLIVITHDEQFVRALGGKSLDTFYYIHKDREGAFSVVEERTFSQLFAG